MFALRACSMAAKELSVPEEGAADDSDGCEDGGGGGGGGGGPSDVGLDVGTWGGGNEEEVAGAAEGSGGHIVFWTGGSDDGHSGIGAVGGDGNSVAWDGLKLSSAS